MYFEVIDLQTGKYPDLANIVLTEDWAKELMYFDTEGFYIGEDGTLCLVDKYGNYAYCPHDRFEIAIELPEIRKSHSFVY